MMSSKDHLGLAALGPLTKLGDGGQAHVYSAEGVRMQYASSLAFKAYKPGVLDALDISVLEAMPSYLESLRFSDGMELLSRAAWPCRLVEQAGSVLGFVMPAIPPHFFINMRLTAGEARVLGEFQHLLNSPDFLRRRQIELSDQQRCELVTAIAASLEIFHRHGIAVGDLSPKNTLFSLKPQPAVFFIDCDAMRFQGRSVAPQLETPGWEVRAVNPTEELGTPEADSYKLALLALRLFAGDQGTRDVGRLPQSMPGDVRQLIRAGLSRSPRDRPIPSDWTRPLARARALSIVNHRIIDTADEPPRTRSRDGLENPSQDDSARRQEVEETFSEDPRLQLALLGLSENELAFAWPTIAHMSDVLTRQDEPLMAWAIRSPIEGLLLVCTSGLICVPNSYSPTSVEFLSRESIQSVQPKSRQVIVVVRNGRLGVHPPRNVIVRPLEDEIDTLTELLDLVCHTGNKRNLLRQFDEWMNADS
jgi:serine/threonine protein kinase